MLQFMYHFIIECFHHFFLSIYLQSTRILVNNVTASPNVAQQDPNVKKLAE